MTEEEATTVALKFAAAKAFQHAGVINSTFFSVNTPFFSGRVNDFWLVYLRLPETPYRELVNTDYAVVEVDCLTGTAQFKLSL